MKKRLHVISLALSLALLLTACGGQQTPSGTNTSTNSGSSEGPATNSNPSTPTIDYPTRDINIVMGAGAGGGTDTAIRPLLSVASQELGHSLVVQNVAGASGSIAAQTVMDAEADGYTVLVNAENPCLYDAYDLLDITYLDYKVLMVVAGSEYNLVVPAGSPYNSLSELVEAEKANPGSIIKARSGPAGISVCIDAMIEEASGVRFTSYTADSSATVATTLLGGFADLGLMNVATGFGYVQSGDLRVIDVIGTEHNELFPEAQTIVEEYPETEKYMPFVTFYAVAVHPDTPDEICEKLTEALVAAFNSKEYQDVLTSQKLIPIGLTGDDAVEYIDTWRKNALGALVNAGMIEGTLADYGY